MGEGYDYDPNADPGLLHPNLAVLAADYDNIIESLRTHRMSASDARAAVTALEARDDFGIRWSIDPDSGRFVRKTAFGDLEFDTPPSHGVATPTGFTYSPTVSDDDPRLRMSVFALGAAQIPLHDHDVSATHRGAAGRHHRPLPRKTLELIADSYHRVPTWGWVLIAAVCLITLVLLLH